MPSHDHRWSDMAGDIFQHRERNDDWGGVNWVYDDTRLNLLRCADEKFLMFLCEIVHPIVRSDQAEAQRLVEIFNRHLAADGFEVSPHTHVSGKPIFAARARLQAFGDSAAPARRIADDLSSENISTQITRMESSVTNDPALAIGTAKEFVETVCKGILAERGVALSGGEDIPKLVHLTRRAIGLAVPDKAGDTMRKTLSALAALTQGIAGDSVRAMARIQMPPPQSPKWLGWLFDRPLPSAFFSTKRTGQASHGGQRTSRELERVHLFMYS